MLLSSLPRRCSARRKISMINKRMRMKFRLALHKFGSQRLSLSRPKGCARFSWAFLLFAAAYLQNENVVAQDFWERTSWPSTRFVKVLLIEASDRIIAGADSGWVLFSSDRGESWQATRTGAGSRSIWSLAVNAEGHIFAGSLGAGLYFSQDSGKSWQRVNPDSLTNNLIRALALDTDNRIFAGTDGSGVFRSEDGGRSWKPANNGLRNFSIRALASDGGEKTIFAGTATGGVYRSGDSGENWRLVDNGLATPRILSLATMTGPRPYVFAGTDNGIFRSSNAGDNWSRVDRGFTNSTIYSLALARSRRGFLYAGTGAGVLRSTNVGGNWIDAGSGLRRGDILSLASDSSGRMFAAQDNGGVFRSVDAALPEIAHLPIDTLSSDNANIVSWEAAVTDDIGVDSVCVFYRNGGAVRFASLRLQALGEDKYRGFIPEDLVNSRGVEYYILAHDRFQNFAKRPEEAFFSVRVRVPTEANRDTAGNPISQSYGSEGNAYRLFSIPLHADDKRPEKILVDALGDYDNKKWRFYSLRDDYYKLPPGTAIYNEFPNTGEMAPGKAFWLIVKDSSRVIHIGPAISNSTDQEYALPLRTGWNFIGSPFNFPLPLASLRFKNRNQAPGLRLFKGEWNDPKNNPVTGILPFEGYALFNATFPEDTLLINPALSSPSLLSKQKPLSNLSEMFVIQILARCQKARDVDNVAMLALNSSLNLDDLDQPEPPVIGEYVSVYFPHREWSTLAKTYCIDARPEPTDGEIWEFEVKTNIRDKVNLSFEGIGEMPKKFEVWLVDDALKITQNLRETNHYAVAGSEQPKQLKLVVGKHDFVGEKLAEAQVIPATYELSQNFPNPFNPATTIRYGLPQSERVTLKIYNLLGEEVALVMNDELRAAGYHAAIWDGRDKNGKVAASGVYVYRIQAGSSVMTKKLALIK